LELPAPIDTFTAATPLQYTKLEPEAKDRPFVGFDGQLLHPVGASVLKKMSIYKDKVGLFLRFSSNVVISTPLSAAPNPSLFPNCRCKHTLGTDMASARAFSTGKACAHNWVPLGSLSEVAEDVS